MNENELTHDNSLRSLIECIVNGEASAAQTRELERHLLEDERARDMYLDYVNLHSSLSRLFLAGAEEEPLDDDLAELPLLLSREGLENLRVRRSRRWLVGLVLATCALLALVIYQSPWLRQSVEPPSADLPLVFRVVGEIQTKTASGLLDKTVIGRSIGDGETLLVTGEEDEIVLRYADGTEIELSGVATLGVAQFPQGGKQLELQSGMLQADVSAQPKNRPLLIITPHARVRVLGTRFELATDQEEGTRLDLESGRVELTRGSEEPISVEPNSIAIVPSGSEPIRVSARVAVVASPQRQASFPGLNSVGFSADGSTLVAATRWQAVYWYEDDRLEAVPLGSGGDKKANVKWQSDSLLVFEEKNPRQLVLWNANGRQSFTGFDDFGGLRRSFSSGFERPDGWKAPVNIAAMSPHGDWLAFQVGRVFRIWQADDNRWPEFSHRYDGKPVTAMAASRDGSMLALAIRRTQIDVVDSYDGTVKVTVPLPHQVPLALDFSADGQRLAAGFAGRVKVYDVASGQVLASFEQPGLAFLQARISPDGRFVAAATGGERVWMWDVETQSELPMFDAGERICNITFSPSGEQLAVVSRPGRLSVWKVAVDKPEIPMSKSDSIIRAGSPGNSAAARPIAW